MGTRRSAKQRSTLRKALQKHTRAAYREAILEAAAAVFGQVGFRKATMADIARAAGVSVGTVYNYFANRSVVVRSLVSREHERFRARMAAIESTDDPLERIRRVIDSSYRFVEERGALLAMAAQAGLLQPYLETREPPTEGEVAHHYMLTVYRTALAEAAERGLLRATHPPNQLAVVLDGMVTAPVQEWLRTGSGQPPSFDTELIVDVFMKGACDS
jgi:AcrR family transcriptional regulator